MKKLKLYLDTSVISYLSAPDTPERMQETLEFWELIKQRKDIDVIISNVVTREIKRCTEPKLTYMINKLRELETTIAEESEETLNIMEIYLKSGVLSDKSLDDLRHIAVAVFNDCRFIVSWNFKHFVNPKTINAVNAINKIHNLPEISIVSPSMMLGGF